MIMIGSLLIINKNNNFTCSSILTLRSLKNRGGSLYAEYLVINLEMEMEVEMEMEMEVV